jgi:hypothetical protein
MKNVRVAFDILDHGKNVPVGYQEIPCHVIFGIKLDLTRKSHYVAGGHEMKPPMASTYASVVS